MRKLICVISMMISLVYSANVMALDSEYPQNDILLTSTEKYYKTVINKSQGISTLSIANNATTYEITKEEYDSVDIISYSINAPTETNYKKMTSSIYADGNYYRYQVDLEWKKYPSTRSYDIIAVAFPTNVKAKGNPSFTQEYCTSSGCTTSNNYYSIYSSTNGVGVLFKLPTGTLTRLKQSMSTRVAKASSGTITKQEVYGDYAHATKNVSASNAEKYTVNTSGIVLNDEIKNSYDEINTSNTTWTGKW